MAEPTTCPRCGAAIPPGSTPGGLCPRCLLQAGMESKGSAADIVYTGQGESSRKPPPTREELAPHFPQLEIGELLGHGGMGAVYRARQKGLDRDVALKVLTVDAGADPSFANRFEREARTLAKLAHPSIVHVYDVGRAGPWYFLVMELVEGANLRQMLRAKTVSPREAMTIVAQMCDALQYAHDEGVVHRDIKPENVLVGRKGTVKILDFGLAKILRLGGGPDPLTKAEQVMGTPYYMAPEQWERPLEVDHRADIYSLGVVFYELLTGELPVGRFAAPSKKFGIDVRLDEVVVKTLEKEPELRYQHVSQVKTEVDRIAASPPVFASAAGAAANSGAPRKRRMWPWIAVAVAATLFFLSMPFLFAFVLVGGKRYAAAESQVAMVAARDHELAAQLDEARAGTFDPYSDKLLPANDALSEAMREYHDLEARHFTLTRRSPDSLLVDVEPFGDELRSMLTRLVDRLNLDDPAKSSEMVDQLLEKAPYGSERVRIHIMRKDRKFSVLEDFEAPEIPDVSHEWEELPTDFLRFWKRAEMSQPSEPPNVQLPVEPR